MTEARRILRCVAAIGMVAPLLLGGCGDDEPDGPEDDAGTTTSTSAPGPDTSPDPSLDTSPDTSPDTVVEFRRVAATTTAPEGCAEASYACDAFTDLACPGDPVPLRGDLLLACGVADDAEVGYLLTAPDIQGGIESAAAAIPEGYTEWVVEIQLDPEAAAAFEQVSTDLVGTGRQFAIVVDGSVLSAPTMEAVIADGRLQITGELDEETANELAGRIAP